MVASGVYFLYWFPTHLSTDATLCHHLVIAGSKRLKAKIALNVPTEDLVYVMGEDVEMRWLGDALARADGQGQS